MLNGKRRITVASPYLDRLKALAGGRRRAAFAATADAVNALLIRIISVGIKCRIPDDHKVFYETGAGVFCTNLS